MPIWEAIVLGIIQGLTEFLPISSTAHLLVVRQLMGHENPKDAFTTAIQLGTLVAVFLYFRSDIVQLCLAFLVDLKNLRVGTSPESRLGWKIVVGTIPVVACGLFFKGFIKEQLYTLPVIAGAAIVFALLLWEAEIIAKGKAVSTEIGEFEIPWRVALFIGCFQALALIPGASRSGVTLTAGLFAGLSRSSAARFSFLLSLPSILGAGLKETYDERATLLAPGQLETLLAGGITAMIVGYLAIAWLLGFLKQHSTIGFVLYRLALGATIATLLTMNVIR
jgi:undecaprenyl-diphosphatase